MEVKKIPKEAFLLPSLLKKTYEQRSILCKCATLSVLRREKAIINNNKFQIIRNISLKHKLCFNLQFADDVEKNVQRMPEYN